MTLTRGERYQIVYRDGGDERSVLAHYRGFGTAGAIAREDVFDSSRSEEEGGLHWFEVDGMTGYLTLGEDDLVSYEPAAGYDSI